MFRPRSLKIFSSLLPDMVWAMDDDECVFLTFDDGPTPGITEWIIEELAKFDASATFFCLGKNIEMYPDLYYKIIEAGHKVGNHSYSHQKGWEVSNDRYVEDVDFANQIVHSDLFRPPYGRIKKSQARILRERYHLIMGGVVSEDYSPLVKPQQCLENVINYIKAGSIVVFHDSPRSYRNMRYALPRTLAYIQKLGLRCSVIEF